MSDPTPVIPRFLADHNFNDHIVTGVLVMDPSIDIVLTRHVGLSQAPDENLLEWAATEGRVILTHDEHTGRVRVRPGEGWVRHARSRPRPPVGSRSNGD